MIEWEYGVEMETSTPHIHVLSCCFHPVSIYQVLGGLRCCKCCYHRTSFLLCSLMFSVACTTEPLLKESMHQSSMDAVTILMFKYRRSDQKAQLAPFYDLTVLLTVIGSPPSHNNKALKLCVLYFKTALPIAHRESVSHPRSCE